MKTQKQIDGYEFTKGALQYVSIFVFKVMVVISVFTVIGCYAGWFRDSTDSDNWHHSGMRLHTDAATGVQYLSDGNGGLTPRLLPDGRLFADGEKAK